MCKETLQLTGIKDLLKHLTTEEMTIITNSLNRTAEPKLVTINNRHFLSNLRTKLTKGYKLSSSVGFNTMYDLTVHLRKRYSLSNIAEYVNEVILFYKENIPEGFKRIPNSYDYVNKDGIIIRWNRLLVDYTTNEKGYLCYHSRMHDDCKPINVVHRAVALTYIPNPDNKLTVNHKDGDKHNNHVSNLEWNTISENSKHAWKTGLLTKDVFKDVGKGESNSQAKLTVDDVRTIRKTLTEKKIQLVKECANLYGTTPDVITDKVAITCLEDLYTLRDVKTNAKKPTYYSREVRVYKGTPQQHVNSILINGINNCRKELMDKYKISSPTLTDIMVRRSWDYEDC